MILAIFGAGGLGSEVADFVLADPEILRHYDEVVFCVTDPETRVLDAIRVVGEEELVAMSAGEAEAVVCVGEPGDREAVFERLEAAGVVFATIVSSEAHVASSASLGRGTVIYPGCYVGPYVTVGDDTVLISGAVVSHDSTVGAHCVLCPKSAVSGHCNIGNLTLVGSGASVKDGTSVGSHCVIALGAAVMQDMNVSTLAIGNPARPLPRVDGDRVFG